MPKPWNSDPPAARRTIERNIGRVLGEIGRLGPDRRRPTVQMAQQWHRDVYAGVTLPVGYYAGEVRDGDARFPDLIGYEVRVGMFNGTPSADVPGELAAYEAGMGIAVPNVDRLLPTGQKPSSARHLTSVVQLAAVTHGEWIRIHPFANGNGRTARIWVAWVAARYGLPIFLTVRPRPSSNRYAIAAQESMTGDHSYMALYLGDRLEEALRLNRGTP